MNYDIEIEQGAQRVGSVTVVKNPQQLYGVRTASGFEIQVPIVLTLRVRPKSEPMLTVNNLRGKVFVKGENGSLLNVGYLTNEERHIAGVTSGEGYDHTSDIELEWRGGLRQKDLAVLLLVTEDSVCYWETGRVNHPKQ